MKYYYDGEYDESKDETGSAEFGSQVTTYADKVIDGYKLDHDRISQYYKVDENTKCILQVRLGGR